MITGSVTYDAAAVRKMEKVRFRTFNFLTSAARILCGVIMVVSGCFIGGGTGTLLVAFGCSWPLNIVKSLQSRTAKGKSVQFEIIVVLGYMVGLAGKIVSWQRTGVLAYSVWFYILNMVMVSIDIVLYFRNSALDREREQGREQR